MIFKVYKPNERDKEFYGYVGKYSLDREAVKEIHGGLEIIYDEPDYATWIIVLDDDEKTVKGFCAFYEKENEIYLDNSYIPKEHRNNGVGKAMFEKRLELINEIANGRPVRGITKTEAQYKIYLKHGFEKTSKRGRFYWLKKETK